YIKPIYEPVNVTKMVNALEKQRELLPKIEYKDESEILENIEESEVAEMPEKEEADIKPEKKAEEKRSNKIQILVAEDNEINRKLIKRTLENYGFEITLANNGQEALDAVKNKKFDLIFMDIAMPVMDGVESLHAILDYELESGIKHTPIVALTANALKGDRERFLNEGFDEYVTKPIKSDKIESIISMFLSDLKLALENKKEIDERDERDYNEETQSIKMKIEESLLDEEHKEEKPSFEKSEDSYDVEDDDSQGIHPDEEYKENEENAQVSQESEEKVEERHSDIREKISNMYEEAIQEAKENSEQNAESEEIKSEKEVDDDIRKEESLDISGDGLDEKIDTQRDKMRELFLDSVDDSLLNESQEDEKESEDIKLFEENIGDSDIEDDSESKDETQVVAEASQTTHKIKSLIAEDNVINQKLIEKTLRNLGLSVDIANNGREAVEMFKTNDYDIVFMDISMPVMDGIDATHEILAYEREKNLKHTPVVALTANALPGDREAFLSEGLDEYISKPLKKEDIIRVLKLFLNYDEESLSKESQHIYETGEEIEDKDSEKQEDDFVSDYDELGDSKELKDVLLFKNNKIEAKILNNMISKFGYTVDSISNYGEFLDKMQNSRYKMVMIDKDMEFIDTKEVIEQIRRIDNEEGRKSAVVEFVSLREDEENADVDLVDEVMKNIIVKSKIREVLDKYIKVK
ncbi:MAG: response regulator, partial [Epsilonproteobacteria bacterium]|nr:response regulator [Campylobacterota bacterium]